MILAYKCFILVLIVGTLPLQLFIGFLVAMTGFPILFVQKRIGKYGKPFFMYKFRSMERDAEQKQHVFSSRNEADGPVFKIRNDPRHTTIGRFLAHTGLDELPQLYNVLQGDMALFGPRPLPVAEAAKLKQWQRKRHLLTPGIISPWILEGYHAQSFDTWMKSDISYGKQKSFWYDVALAGKAMHLSIRLLLKELFSFS